jgi:hypothetical protein
MAVRVALVAGVDGLDNDNLHEGNRVSAQFHSIFQVNPFSLPLLDPQCLFAIVVSWWVVVLGRCILLLRSSPIHHDPGVFGVFLTFLPA